jgi:hypothetical protein
MWAQYSDDSKTTVISVFSSPQDIDEYPNSEELDISSQAYKAFYNSMPDDTKTSIPTPTTTK